MRAVAVALFVAIVLLSLDWQLLLMAWPSRRPTEEAMARRADPNPELAAFLAGVRSQTKRGDTIVLVIPPLLQHQADAYRFRASYHLAGRSVLPADPENVRRATHVAAWRVPVRGCEEIQSGRICEWDGVSCEARRRGDAGTSRRRRNEADGLVTPQRRSLWISSQPLSGKVIWAGDGGVLVRQR